MSESRSLPISIAMLLNASQRWSAMSRLCAVIAPSSFIARQCSGPGESGTALPVSDQPDRRGGVEKEGIRLEHFVHSGHRGEGQVLCPAGAVSVHRCCKPRRRVDLVSV